MTFSYVELYFIIDIYSRRGKNERQIKYVRLLMISYISNLVYNFIPSGTVKVFHKMYHLVDIWVDKRTVECVGNSGAKLYNYRSEISGTAIYNKSLKFVGKLPKNY